MKSRAAFYFPPAVQHVLSVNHPLALVGLDVFMQCGHCLMYCFHRLQISIGPTSAAGGQWQQFEGSDYDHVFSGALSLCRDCPVLNGSCVELLLLVVALPSLLSHLDPNGATMSGAIVKTTKH
jgi:hypothetical protein